MKAKPHTIFLLASLAALAAIVWFLRAKAGGSELRRVTGQDGRVYRQIKYGLDNGSGAVWRTVPDDGNEYFPDLGWETGASPGPPIFRRYS